MIIGIAGNAGVGKDTVADHLVAHHGFVKVSLADPMKRICRDVFDFSEDQLWGASEERNKSDYRYQRYENETIHEAVAREIDEEVLSLKPRGPKFLNPRHALQQLGTEWGRDCYENVWVEYALRVADKILQEERGYSLVRGLNRLGWEGSFTPKGVVIPDVRFKNEVEAIRAAGGKVWKLTRPIPRLEGAAGQHQSETELDGIDSKLFHAFIENSSTLEKLYQSVEFCLGEK